MNSASESKIKKIFMVKIPSMVKDALKEFGSPSSECISAFYKLASIFFFIIIFF